jgi:hypothetical protein
MGAGVHDLALVPDDLRGVTSPTNLVLRLTAASAYSGGASDVAQAAFQVNGGGSVLLPSRAQLLGNWPNPAQPSTRIGFLLPSAGHEAATLAVFDAAGRRVRTFRGGFAAGLNQIAWDGSDDNGRPVRAGLYFYRLDIGHEYLTHRLVVVR